MPRLGLHRDHRVTRVVLGIVGGHALLLAVAFLSFASVQEPCAQDAGGCRDLAGLFLLLGIIAGLAGRAFVLAAVWAGFRGDERRLRNGATSDV